MGPSSMLPTLPYSQTERYNMNHPLSRSFSSDHYKPRSSNDVPFRPGTPSNATYQTSSGRVGPPHNIGLSPSDLPNIPLTHPSRTGAGIQYDPRFSRPSDVERIPIQGSSESQLSGSSTMGRSMQDTSGQSPSVSKYECSYCGKGFNRPSSLKVCWFTCS